MFNKNYFLKLRFLMIEFPICFASLQMSCKQEAGLKRYDCLLFAIATIGTLELTGKHVYEVVYIGIIYNSVFIFYIEDHSIQLL